MLPDRLEGGLCNEVYRWGCHILTIYKKASPSRLWEMIFLTGFLREKGFPVPAVKKTVGGFGWAPWVWYDQRQGAAVFACLPGATLPCYLPRHLRAAGKMLARLHHALTSYPRRRFLPRRAGDGRFHCTAACFHQPTVLHNDFARANLLFNRQGVVGVLDWEYAAAGCPLVDVARSLSLFYRDQPSQREEEIRRPFLEGYFAGGGEEVKLSRFRKKEAFFLD